MNLNREDETMKPKIYILAFALTIFAVGQVSAQEDKPKKTPTMTSDDVPQRAYSKKSPLEENKKPKEKKEVFSGGAIVRTYNPDYQPNVVVYSNPQTLEDALMARDRDDALFRRVMAKMYDDDKVALIPVGTKCVVQESTDWQIGEKDYQLVKIRIEEGSFRGRTGWLPIQWLKAEP